MGEFALRFALGGLVVCTFAALGDVLRPKSFAGLLGAAPSVGIATLSIAIFTKGQLYASVEARSMCAATIGFLVYACVVSRILAKRHWHALVSSVVALPLWFAVSFGIWFLVFR